MQFLKYIFLSAIMTETRRYPYKQREINVCFIAGFWRRLLTGFLFGIKRRIVQFSRRKQPGVYAFKKENVISIEQEWAAWWREREIFYIRLHNYTCKSRV